MNRGILPSCSLFEYNLLCSQGLSLYLKQVCAVSYTHTEHLTARVDAEKGDAFGFDTNECTMKSYVQCVIAIRAHYHNTLLDYSTRLVRTNATRLVLELMKESRVYMKPKHMQSKFKPRKRNTNRNSTHTSWNDGRKLEPLPFLLRLESRLSWSKLHINSIQWMTTIRKRFDFPLCSRECDTSIRNHRLSPIA